MAKVWFLAAVMTVGNAPGMDDSVEGESDGDDESNTDTAKAAALDYVGYTSAYRSLAKSLDVDPYTCNNVLRDELTRHARAAFAGVLR